MLYDLHTCTSSVRFSTFMHLLSTNLQRSKNFGLSVSALFLIRDDSFLQSVPEEHKQVFMDENPLAPEKIKVLKNMIDDRFPVS